MSQRKGTKQGNKLLKKADENRTVRRFVAISLLLIAILFVGIIGGSIMYVNSALKPVNKDNDEKMNVTIPIGSSVTQIAKILEKQGAIKSALVFRYYVKFKSESDFQAGEYELSTSMDVREIISKLKEGKVDKEVAIKFTIPEGTSLSDIAEIISKQTPFSKKEILSELQNEEFIDHLSESYPMLDPKVIKQEGIRYSLEGYLFPATYGFEKKDTSLQSLLTAMVARMQTVIDQYEEEIASSGYTVHEILTLASLIETETQKAADRFKVSGVFHNRLQQNMRLDSDPTVKYALEKKEIQVTYKDTDVSSPYNTYRMVGIPIGPIASPREESIEAALHPKELDEFYFFARPNGQVIYTKTLNEHEKVVTKYRHEWNDLIKKQKSTMKN